MNNPFLPPAPPCRIRFETEAVSRDIQAPAALAVFPDPSNPALIEVIEQHQTHAQIIALVATVIRWATVQGLIGDVMRQVVMSPIDVAQLTDYGNRRTGPIPPDDIPPHLRGHTPKG